MQVQYMLETGLIFMNLTVKPVYRIKPFSSSGGIHRLLVETLIVSTFIKCPILKKEKYIKKYSFRNIFF